MRAADLGRVRSTLWRSADQMRANSSLTPSEYRGPVLGLIFLAYAEHRFNQVRPVVEARATARNPVTADSFRRRGVLFIPEPARLSFLVGLPEGEDVGAAVNQAMQAIEEANPDLRGVLPRQYRAIDSPTLIELLRLFAPLPSQLSGDAFGLIYEDFLSNFAMQEGKGGGEFFTPYSIVRLIVEIIEPYHGRVLDPACGSGGMFVQSARFVERHQGAAAQELSIYGMEQKRETVPLAKMNLALHGLSGDVRLANSYYEDPHRLVGGFDFVMANPPFNVDGIRKTDLAGDLRFPFGLPKPDNGNYIWIQLFYAALGARGRAGFVMAASAPDARSSEQDIRRQLIESGAVDVMIAIGPNFFYTVTLPVTLWFLDKTKRGTAREDQVLFIDARGIYRQIDRAHRDFTPAQSEFLANIVRLYRGEEAFSVDGSVDLVHQHFPAGTYVDVPGLCKVANRAEVEAQGWSLNPGRYTGTKVTDDDEQDFTEHLTRLHQEFTHLTNQAEQLQTQVDTAIAGIIAE